MGTTKSEWQVPCQEPGKHSSISPNHCWECQSKQWYDKEKERLRNYFMHKHSLKLDPSQRAPKPRKSEDMKKAEIAEEFPRGTLIYGYEVVSREPHKNTNAFGQKAVWFIRVKNLQTKKTKFIGLREARRLRTLLTTFASDRMELNRMKK